MNRRALAWAGHCLGLYLLSVAATGAGQEADPVEEVPAQDWSDEEILEWGDEADAGPEEADDELPPADGTEAAEPRQEPDPFAPTESDGAEDAVLDEPEPTSLPESEAEQAPTFEGDLVAEPIVAPPERRALTLSLSAGIGFGTFSYERPIAAGSEVLQETPFAAADLGLAIALFPHASVHLELDVRYQTSLGMRTRIEPLFALPEKVSTRLQVGEVSIGPVFALSNDVQGPRVRVALGMALHNFVPYVHQYGVERITWGGPTLSGDLRLPLGELLSVSLSPQAQWIVLLNSALSDQGACCSGMAIAGAGSVEAKVGSHFRAGVAYSQTLTLSPAGAFRFRALERFLTARVTGEF